MKVVRTIAGVVVASALLAAPAGASSLVPLRIDPKRPAVDDTVVRVSFTVRTQLAKGRHYTALILTETGGRCASFVGVDSSRRPKKGGTVTLRFSARHDEFYPGARWCAGRATVSVATLDDAEDSTDTGTLLGARDFRFARSR